EDGIRDFHVTGVQTCALPISHLLFRIPFLYPVQPDRPGKPTLKDRAVLYGADCYFEAYDRYQPLKNGKPHTRLTDEELHELEPRSEERRVGKEWSSQVARAWV